MPRSVSIQVFLLASSRIVDSSMIVPYDGYDAWLKRIGASDFLQQLMADEDNRTDAETIVEMAGRRCYMSFQPGLNPNITKVRKDLADYLDNILSSGHGSVLEHVTYTFAFEGVSRVFTGEMNRHRAGWAISEGSMRYIRFEDLPYWIPTSIQGTELDDIHNLSQEEELIWKKQQSRFVFHKAFDYAQELYQELMDIWKDELAPESKFAAKKQITSMMRRIIPMGVATGGIWTGNIRALRHVIAMRTSPAAEEEICYVFSNVIKMLADLEPNFFGDFQELEGGFWVPKYVKV